MNPPPSPPPPTVTPPTGSAPGAPPSRAGDFELERFKYILQQLNGLNEQAHKYFALFQTLATAIVGGVAVVFYTWADKKLPPDLTRLTIHALVGLFVIVAVFAVLAIVATIRSWMDYRREETELLDAAVRPGYRRPPTYTNCTHWGETHMLIFIVVVAIAVAGFVECLMIPKIQ